jgi:anti-sigma factor RsiW
MGKQSGHPERELIDYLDGRLNDDAAGEVAAHLESCGECRGYLDTIRVLRSQKPPIGGAGGSPPVQSASEPDENDAHPDVGELASFFYSKSSRAGSAALRSHVALCASCSNVLSQYALAEKLANSYVPSTAKTAEIPARAWELIAEWEESSFAKPKESGEANANEVLSRLAAVLAEQKDALREQALRTLGREYINRPGLVPVVVVDSAGQFKGVEIFERHRDAAGVEVLRHSQRSEKYDDKRVHVFFESGEARMVTASTAITRDTIRIQRRKGEKTGFNAADYFIVED